MTLSEKAKQDIAMFSVPWSRLTERHVQGVIKCTVPRRCGRVMVHETDNLVAEVADDTVVRFYRTGMLV